MALQDEATASSPRSRRRTKADPSPATGDHQGVAIAAEQLEEANRVQALDVTLLDENPQNPRRVFVDVEGLAADIGARGVLQPLLVRPREGRASGRFEIVFGARRFRASKLAGLKTLPAIVREYSDAEALEIAIVENSQRADVHPLEEADGYRTLREAHGYSVDEIAAKVGKSHAHVYGRLKFCALVPDAREAFLEGKLTAATALLVARIPHEDLQKKALKKLLAPDWHGDLPSLSEAQRIVREHFMLRLVDAPFDRTDATLVAGAPACGECPKRTGCQRDLFAELEAKDDLCTDPKCFEAKRDAAWERTKVEAKEKGQKVLSQKESARLFPYSGSQLVHNADYVDLSEKHYDPKTGKGTPMKKIVGAAADEVPIVLARDQEGRVHELAPRTAVNKLLPKEERQKMRGGGDAVAKKERERARLEKERHREQLGELVAAAERSELGELAWVALARAMVRMVWADVRVDVMMRRGIEIPKGKRHEAEAILLRAAHGMTAAEARGLCVEIATHGRAFAGSLDPNLKELREAFGCGKPRAARAPSKKGGRK